ncbi:MAG: 5'-3' exonuclease H3TH domain-containing protein [Patescibacteria group bacterium]|nr:5'-3' exonuclease H3TH domain-containing protein [Patescibacteria group bacterium]
MSKPKFVIIDGNAILHRAFHALPQLKTREGVVVNAVYGFASLIMKILREIEPEYIAVPFDRKEKTFRHQMYKEYKAKRPKAPQELYDQIPIIKDMLHVFKIKTYEKAGFEADDIIATLAKTKTDTKNIILTGDKDTLQLVDDDTVVYALKGGVKDVIIYDEEKVKERYELSPDQLVDYKALRGDPSDNIPGVRGIGKKTATELLKKFGTVEQLYKELVKETLKTKDIREKTKKLLLSAKPEAFESKELVTLIDNVPVDFYLKDCKNEPLDKEKIKELFMGLGFASLVKRLEEGVKTKSIQRKLL